MKQEYLKPLMIGFLWVHGLSLVGWQSYQGVLGLWALA
jgi:hypothetical protein